MVEHGEACLLGTNSKAPGDTQPVVNTIFPHLKCSLLVLNTKYLIGSMVSMSEVHTKTWDSIPTPVYWYSMPTPVYWYSIPDFPGCHVSVPHPWAALSFHLCKAPSQLPEFVLPHHLTALAIFFQSHSSSPLS